jgi:hypothetical protein
MTLGAGSGFAGAGGHQNHVGLVTQRAKDLVAVEHVLVTFAPCRGAQRLHVGACIGLGDGHRNHFLSLAMSGIQRSS